MKNYICALEVIKRELKKEYTCPEAKYAFEVAIDALEKQIPVDSHYVSHSDECYNYVCPSCLWVNISNPYEKGKYCQWCGQKIKWN